MEYFISDFAQRTKTNLEIINEMEELSPQKPYEVTQLINSLLGLVVLPYEKFKNWEEKKNNAMEAVEKNIWDLLEACEADNRYFNSFDDRHSKKVLEFINHIRNAVSHSGKMGLHFYPIVEGGDTKITHIIFYDSDYGIRLKWNKKNPKKAHIEAKEFCLKLTINEAREMANYISDLYCHIEKNPGRDMNYERIIEKLDILLHEKKTAFEGTVLEQFIQ